MRVSGGAEEAMSARPEPSTSDVPDVRSTTERTIVDLRGLTPFVSVGHYRYLAAHDPLPMQLHSRLFVLAFAVRSRFDFQVNGEVVAVEPGDAIIIPPGNTYSTGVGAQTRGELMWLVVQSSPATSSVGAEWRQTQKAVEDLQRLGVTTFRSPRLTIDLLARVVADGDEAWEGMDAWRETLCAAAFVELWRGLREAEPLPDHVHPGLRQAVTWATANIETAIKATDLVAVSGISSTRFYELFFESFGTSPKDYILRMKIERAAELLRTTTLSVTDICYRLGFSSSQHFGTAFRRYVGSSPSTYRTQQMPDTV